MNRKLPYKDDFEMQQLLGEVFTPNQKTLRESFDDDIDGWSILEKYMDANRLRQDDVKDLKKVCEALGYTTGYFLNADAIWNFLADNPGAMEKIYEFIAEWIGHNEEWKEALTEEEYDEEDQLRREEEEDLRNL